MNQIDRESRFKYDIRTYVRKTNQIIEEHAVLKEVPNWYPLNVPTNLDEMDVKDLIMRNAHVQNCYLQAKLIMNKVK